MEFDGVVNSRAAPRSETNSLFGKEGKGDAPGQLRLARVPIVLVIRDRARFMNTSPEHDQRLGEAQEP
jgi:hypothetical protein